MSNHGNASTWAASQTQVMSRDAHLVASRRDDYELITSACFWIGEGEERRRLRAAGFQPADMASPNIVAIEASTEPRHEGLGLRLKRRAALLIRLRYFSFFIFHFSFARSGRWRAGATCCFGKVGQRARVQQWTRAFKLHRCSIAQHSRGKNAERAAAAPLCRSVKRCHSFFPRNVHPALPRCRAVSARDHVEAMHHVQRALTVCSAVSSERSASRSACE